MTAATAGGPDTGLERPPAQDDLLARYRALVARGAVAADPAQERAVAALADLARRLEAGPASGAPAATRSPLSRLIRVFAGPATTKRIPVRGLYLWGGVGRGKTWLMDLFYDCLPFPERRRSHFHRFMAQVHDHLGQLGDTQDPLEQVAAAFADRYRLLCFDELFVSDITDAMLLGTLFRALFARGVTLVATSNVPPADLYRDGLQRARFLPAIAELEAHTQVFHLDSGIDYRLRLLERAEIYHHPADAEADRHLEHAFEQLCADLPGTPDDTLEVAGRAIRARRIGDGVVWFDFDAICGGPRSQTDYIAIAAEYHTVLVSGVPRFTPERENEARRFIALVDEFYDRAVKLMLSAAAPVGSLYAGDLLAFEFERTRSRLLEMQSREYLARPHLP